MHKGVTWILKDQVCNWAGHLILAQGQCCWGLCCGRVLPGVETLSWWKGSVGSGCGEVIVGLTMEKNCETFCWDIWDLRVFHANFLKTSRCFSGTIYRLVGSSKAQRDDFCRAGLRTSPRETGQEPKSFLFLYLNIQLTKQAGSCTDLMQLLN